MKRIVILFLILSVIMSLLSCSGDNDQKDSDVDNSVEETTEAIPKDYLNNLSDERYPGETFTIIGKYDVSGAHNFPEETETGEPVNDALYYRDRAVEERYGITFNYIKTSSGGDTVSQVEAETMSGGTKYNMIQGSMLTCTNVLLNKGLLLKINDIKYIDLSNPWWNTRCASDLSINGNFYYITGNIMFEHYMEAACILFNKRMVEDYKIEDLYSIVKEGKWTFDKMTETASVISADSDYYRFGLNDISGYSFYFGAGLTITKFDNKGTPYFEPNITDKMVNVIDKYSRVFADESISMNNTYNWANNTLETKGGSESYFTKGEMLYYTSTTSEVIKWRSLEIDFGILPIPKYDESQSDYISYANPWQGSSVAFPISLENSDMTGLITEALAYESKVYFEPAMYDNLLKTRGVRDEESSAMLDIIYNSKTFDLCDICEWGGLNYLIRDNMLGARDTIASDYAATITNATAQLQDTVALFNK